MRVELKLNIFFVTQMDFAIEPTPAPFCNKNKTEIELVYDFIQFMLVGV